ncbi:hypothetical protein [Streptomyces spinosirectus]
MNKYSVVVGAPGDALRPGRTGRPGRSRDFPRRFTAGRRGPSTSRTDAVHPPLSRLRPDPARQLAPLPGSVPTREPAHVR